MKKIWVGFWGLLIGSLLGNIWSFWRVLRPVQNLVARAAHLAQGDMSALEQPCGGIREIGELRHTMATMAQHVQRAQAEGLTYRHALTDGQEEERARIARELHDDTVQSLVAIAQSIELGLNWLESDPTRAKSMLGLARTGAIESVENLRRLIADLRPPALEELGIVPALRMLAQTDSDDLIAINVSGSERRIDAAYELALFRLAQEAIRNARQHASPTRISLTLAFYSHEVTLTVKDNGVGFHFPVDLDCFTQEAHFGLIGMRERVRQLKGNLTIDSTPGKGTTIHAVLPLDVMDQPTDDVRDPVCGALIHPHRAYGSTVYEGERYYFCCPVCQGAFQQHAETYVALKITSVQ
ncbi:MAG: histidine kinase [Chloroflexota bacterium]|nr:histidine kinase [Chloroflexota bacterium]